MKIPLLEINNKERDSRKILNKKYDNYLNVQINNEIVLNLSSKNLNNISNITTINTISIISPIIFYN